MNPKAALSLPAVARSKTRLRMWLGLLKVSRRLEAEIRDRLRREFATTLPRFDVLAMLERFGDGLKMSELSSRLMVSNGNVTGIIDRLVDDGWVARVSIKGDRRATLVRLTPAGKAEFARMAAAHEGWITDLLGDLTEAEIKMTLATLGRIRKIREG
ncbi:MAG: MarR family transcriptional regulator [Rhodobacteraceae bacterium]|nr:MarR family transcriptional regulator [Paracoccaceae bacterium]